MEEIPQLKEQIGQIEASIDLMGKHLNSKDFQDYCDNAYSCISYIRQSIEQIRRLANG